MEIVKITSSEHWYDHKGNPAPDATLREARKQNLLPSVTTVLKDLPKPGLQAWKDEQLVLAALTLPRVAGETDIAFCKRVVEDSKEQSKKAAEKGSDIHKRIEDYLKDKGHSLDGYPSIREWIDKNVQVVLHVERSMSSLRHGYAGRIDALVIINNRHTLIDFKTQATTPGKKIKKYDEWCYQLAAGFFLFGTFGTVDDCMNLVISTTEDRIEEVTWSFDDISHAWEVFLTALKLFRQTRKFPYERPN